MSDVPVAASASSAPAGTLEGPAPKRPSAGFRSSGITMSLTPPIVPVMAGVTGWRIERLPIDHPDAARLVEEVQGEYVVRYGGRDETPISPTYFHAPDGAFFVGYLDAEPVVTGAWRRRADVLVDGTSLTAEVKRMYVAPQARRRGFASVVLARLEDTAREAGADVMVLETGLKQPEAIRLYTERGYLPVDRFGFYADSPLSRYFGRRL